MKNWLTKYYIGLLLNYDMHISILIKLIFYTIYKYKLFYLWIFFSVTGTYTFGLATILMWIFDVWVYYNYIDKI